MKSKTTTASTPPPKKAPEGLQKGVVPAVERAARLLALLEGTPHKAFSLAEIARRLEIPKSTALNICSELVLAQFVRRSQSGYQLGRRLVQLGSAYVASVDLIREFYEVCNAIDADLGAIIQLSVLDDQLNAVYLARQDHNSRLQLGLRAEIGRHVPANCTASGKALLAALPEENFESRVAGLRKLTVLTPNSIGTVARLRRELKTIREQGYALDDEEVLPKIACVARALTTDHREDGLLSVSITAPKVNGTLDRQKTLRFVLDRFVETMQSRL
ncbi:IclR family transcriptional regulator [Pelagibacterium nitratireducens]|uniref:IclR family transcriptional regulator n=1 Tax=Pelagibacterium nitratireducens TaxID=1046114 RepID=A0ABZ2I5Z9_9HYPH